MCSDLIISILNVLQKKIYSNKKLDSMTNTPNTSAVENSKVKSTTNKFVSMKDGVKKLNKDIEKLNGKLETVTNELSEEKSNIVSRTA